MSYTVDDLARDVAEKTAREGTTWTIGPFGGLRNQLGECPLRFVFPPAPHAPSDYMDRAEARGMSRPTVNSVINGADFEKPARVKDREARQKLMRAMGLA